MYAQHDGLLVLILAGKADMIVNGRGHIRTISQLLPRPSVIRLETQVHRPRPHVKLTRREIFRRDNYTCQYCGRREVNLTVDHVIPRHWADSIFGRIWWRLVLPAITAKAGAKWKRHTCV